MTSLTTAVSTAEAASAAPDAAATRPAPASRPRAPYRLRPPAPVPRETPMNYLQLVLALRDNPLDTWTRRHFEEPILSGSGFLGHVTVVSHPATIREALVEKAGDFVKDELQRRVLSPGLGDGLLTAEGETWRATRRTLAPLFTPRATHALAERMRAVCEARAARLVTRPGRTVDVVTEMTRLTFDVLAETLFSNALEGSAEQFGRALTAYFEALGRIDPLDVLGIGDWAPRIGRIRARPSIRFFEEAVRRIVERRNALIAADPAAVPDDLLSRLLQASDPETGVGLTEREVGANIMTFIGAGHETTANTLSWTLHLLGTHPEARRRAEEEADAVAASGTPPADWPEAAPFARACIEEALRLYPPAPSLSRAPTRDITLAGRRVPKDSLVVIAPYVVGRHRLLWEDPDAFVPERFLPGRREAIDRFAFIPFGAGPRVCIGQGFAVQEAVIALVCLLTRARLNPVPGHRVRPVHRVTLRPEGGLPMRVERRG